MLEPPVFVVPSGSLKVRMCGIGVPERIRDVTPSRNVVSLSDLGAPQSIGTNWSFELESCDEGLRP